MKSIQSLFLCVYCLSLFGQESFNTTDLTMLVQQKNWNIMMSSKYRNIEGNPYMHKDFRDGEIYFNNSENILYLPLRLDIYRDQLEFLYTNVARTFEDPSIFDRVIIGEDVLIYVESPNPKIDGFVKLWNNEFPALVTKMHSVFLEREDAMPFDNEKPARFQRANDRHFLLTEKGKIQKIKSIKKLIALLGDKEDELTRYAKERKISAVDVEEMVQLVEYFHSIK